MEKLIYYDKGIYAYQGSKHPYEVPLTIGEIAAVINGEYSPREIVLEVFKRLHEFESTELTPEQVQHWKNCLEIPTIKHVFDMATKIETERDRLRTERDIAIALNRDCVAELDSLRTRLAEVEAERDAAVECAEEVEYSLANSRFSAAWAAIRKWRGKGSEQNG